MCLNLYEAEFDVTLRLKISQSFRLGIKPLPGAHGHILLIISSHSKYVHQSSLAILYWQSSSSEAGKI
jgi:hypothetical protein